METQQYTVKISDRGYRSDGRYKRSFISVSLHGSMEEADRRRWMGKMDGTLDPKDADRQFRQQVKAVTALLKTLPQFALCDIAFSAKAGCRCGCSPGWLFQHGTDPGPGIIFYVSIDDAPVNEPAK